MWKKENNAITNNFWYVVIKREKKRIEEINTVKCSFLISWDGALWARCHKSSSRLIKLRKLKLLYVWKFLFFSNWLPKSTPVAIRYDVSFIIMSYSPLWIKSSRTFPNIALSRGGKWFCSRLKLYSSSTSFKRTAALFLPLEKEWHSIFFFIRNEFHAGYFTRNFSRRARVHPNMFRVRGGIWNIN